MVASLSQAIEIEGLTKTFGNNRKALDCIDLRFEPGQMVALIGASGSGKSTLLRHLSGLVAGDRCPSTIKVFGQTVQENGRIAKNIHAIRSRIGFVFQQFNLVNRLPVITNVVAGRLARIPTWRSLAGWFTRAEKELALEALHRVGILDCANQRAGTLSGGQQQRAAIARALVQEAEVILADEPIASLDPESSRCVMSILSDINRKDGTSVLVSLHQVDFAINYCSRVIGLKDGKVVYDGPSAGLNRSILDDIYKTEASSRLEGEASFIKPPDDCLCPACPQPLID